jgi:pantothenate kinase
VDEHARLERLIARHMAFGRTRAEAEGRAYGSDQRNAELIAASRDGADLIVWSDER